MDSIIADRPLLFIAHNNSDIVHWGEVDANQNISTGQPELELFELDERESWDARLQALGIDRVALEAENDPV